MDITDFGGQRHGGQHLDPPKALECFDRLTIGRALGDAIDLGIERAKLSLKIFQVLEFGNQTRPDRSVNL